MSEARRIIEFVFQGTDNLSSGLGTMSDNLGSLADGLEAGTQPLANFTTGLLEAEAAVAVAGLALAAFAVNEAGQFDAAMRELTTLVGGGEEQLQAFTSTVQTMGQDSIVSLEDLEGAMYKAVSQTGNLEDAAAAVNQAEQLAIAGRADLTDTTLLLVGVLASYGEGMASAAAFSDVLFSVVQNGQTTLTELAAGFGNVAPTAAAAGVDIEDLGAAIALLTKNGISTSAAMTGVKAALSNIISPSQEAAEMAESLGINFSVAGIESLGFAGFMQLVAEKTGGSTEKISALFGSVEAFNAVMVLTRNTGTDFTKMLDDIKAGAGSTEAAYKLMADTFNAKNQQIANNLKLVGIAFGLQILEPVGNVQEALAAFLIALQNSISAGAFEPLFTAVQQVLNDLAESLTQIAAIFPEAAQDLDFSGLLDAFADLADAASSLFDDVDLTTPEGLHHVLQTIIDTVETFIRVTTGLAEKMLPVVKEFADWALAANELSPELKENIGHLLGLGTILNTVAPSVNYLATAISGLSLAIGGQGLVAGLKYALPFIAALTGPVGIAVAGAAAVVASDYFLDWSDAIVETGQSLLGLNPSVEEVGASLLEQKTGTEDLTTAMGALIGSAFSTVDAEDKLTAAQKEQTAAIYATIPSFDLLDKTLAQIGKTYVEVSADFVMAGVKVTDAIDEQTDSIEDGLKSWRELGGVERDTTLATDLAAKGFKFVKDEVVDLETGLTRTADVFTYTGESAVDAGENASTALSKTAKEALEAQEAANKFALGWEELASQERMFMFEVGAQVQIAQIQAGTEQVIAAFESVNTTIESTGTTLVGLAGILADIGSGPNAGVIIDLLEEENARREEGLELQKKLVDAQVRYMDAVVARMTQGEAQIQITSDGLEVELTQFMMKILEKIQVQANEQAQQFLLGL
jgi:TP901 family phage tail tape measure protein